MFHGRISSNHRFPRGSGTMSAVSEIRPSRWIFPKKSAYGLPAAGAFPLAGPILPFGGIPRREIPEPSVGPLFRPDFR